MASNDRSSRVLGLDVMRTVAVGLVVVGHILQHGHPPDWLGHVGRLGIMGVDIFFVLSGFLIGGIVLSLVRKNRFSTWADLRKFWVRRWMRTLPLYYLFFFIYLRYDWTGPSRLQDRLQFLVFMQNFAWPAPDFYLLSWSLTIEEFFYLLFPLLLFFLLRRSGQARSSTQAALLVFLVVPLLIKFCRAPYADWDGFNYNLRMVTITRLDSLMYGVGAVFIKHTYPEVWSALRRATRWSWILLALMATYLYVNLPYLAGSRLIQTFVFPLMSFSIALMLPVLDDWKGTRGSLWRERIVTYVSTISYSIYLGHILVLTLLDDYFQAAPGAFDHLYTKPVLLYPIDVLLIGLFTPLTYHFWERPFMMLRDGEIRLPWRRVERAH